MLSFKLASVFILLAVAGCVSVTCVPVNVAYDCAARFEASFNEILNLKRICPQANFQDCCKLTQSIRILYNNSGESGVYPINSLCGKLKNSFFFSNPIPQIQASCDMTTDGGGWLVLARRTPDGERVNFDRTWSEYEEGFGDLNNEFWYGLKNMHCVTSGEPMQVRFDLKTTDGVSTTWTYNKFVVDGSNTQYTLHIGEPQQTGSDYFAYHNNMKFSTHDNDNDGISGSCSSSHDKSGWWYNSCYHMSFTLRQGFKTTSLPGAARIYAYAEMKIRPLSCQLLTNDTPRQCT